MVAARPDVEKPTQTSINCRSIVKKDKSALESSSILPKTLILSLQITGEFPYALNKYSVPWCIWSAVPVGFSVYFACSYAYVSFGRFKVELKSLEFFKILEIIFRISVLLCGSISAMVCLCKSRQIKQLFLLLQKSSVLRTGRCTTAIEMSCLIWQFVCILGVIYSVQHTYYVIYAHLYPYLYPNWITRATSILAGSAHAPPLSEVFWTTFGKLCCSWQNFAPQMIVLYTAVIIGRFWKNLGHDLSQSARDKVLTLSQPNMLRLVHKQYRDSYCILKKLNEAFSLVILVNCIEELIINVAIIAYLLRNGDGQQEDDIQRIVFGSIGTTNMILKIFASIYCDEQARKMKEFLLENFVLNENGSDQVIAYAKDFHREISSNCNALTGGGCFLLNTEYVLTCFGLLLTYLLLVYQMRDGKNDNAELAKLIVNSTAVLQDKLDQLLRLGQKI